MSSLDEHWKSCLILAMHTAKRSTLLGPVWPNFFLMKLSFSIHPVSKERPDMQQGLEDNQSLTLHTHKVARPFTQPYLSYESIQRASCSPALEHIRSALMKMFCILRKDYNILFSCNTSLLFQSLTENHWGMFWWLEVWISIEQKAERHFWPNLPRCKIPFHFCLWLSCKQFLKNNWVLQYYQYFYHLNFLGLETKIQKYLPNIYFTLFICGISTFHRTVQLPESSDKRNMHTLPAYVHLYHSRNNQSLKNAQII